MRIQSLGFAPDASAENILDVLVLDSPGASDSSEDISCVSIKVALKRLNEQQSSK